MFGKLFIKGNKQPPDPDDTDPSLLKKKVDIKKEKHVEDDYEIFELLGSGKFGEVKRCVERKTDKQFAAKFVICNSPDEQDSVMMEIKVMKKLRHARLLQLYDAYNYKKTMVLILELVTGGELFERVIDETFDLTEEKCEKFMREICQGVEYIHSQKVIHLDLKPENILCLTPTGFRVKIIDFGLARFIDKKDIRVMFGTPEFVAPEIIAYEPVGPATDMWSVGVICYVLLSGLSPFMGENDGETFGNVLKGKYTFDYEEFHPISSDAQDFIRNCLQKDPKKRLSARELLNHNWMKEVSDPLECTVEENTCIHSDSLTREGIVSKRRLKHFVYRRKWQKAVNAIIALIRLGVKFSNNTQTESQIPRDRREEESIRHRKSIVSMGDTNLVTLRSLNNIKKEDEPSTSSGTSSAGASSLATSAKKSNDERRSSIPSWLRNTKNNALNSLGSKKPSTSTSGSGVKKKFTYELGTKPIVDVVSTKKKIDTSKFEKKEESSSTLKNNSNLPGSKQNLIPNNSNSKTANSSIKGINSTETQSKVKPALKVEQKSGVKPILKPFSKPEAKPSPKVDRKAEVKQEPTIELNTSTKPEAKPSPKVDRKPEVKQEPKIELNTSTKPEAKPSPKVDRKPEVKQEPKVELKASPKAEVKPEVKQEPKVELNTSTKPEAKPSPKVDRKPEVKQEPKIELNTSTKPEAKPSPKVDRKPEVKQEPKVELKASSKAEPKPEVKQEPKVELKASPKAEPKPEVKQESKVELKPSLKVEAKPEAKLSPKAESKPVVKQESKVELKPSPKVESKPEVKQESKVELKPSLKVEAKPEAKPSLKVESKPEVKQESKVEIRPSPKAEPKPVVKQESKVELKTSAKPEAKPSPKLERKPEVNTKVPATSVDTTKEFPSKKGISIPIKFINKSSNTVASTNSGSQPTDSTNKMGDTHDNTKDSPAMTVRGASSSKPIAVSIPVKFVNKSGGNQPTPSTSNISEDPVPKKVIDVFVRKKASEN